MEARTHPRIAVQRGGALHHTVLLEVLCEARELRALRLQLLSELLVLQLQARARRSALRELRGRLSQHLRELSAQGGVLGGQSRDARVQLCRRLLIK